MQTEQANITLLIAGCKKGDRKAQEQLYRSFYKAMVSLCLRYTRQQEDALEVLNTGFLKVFQHIDRYQPDKSAFYTWMRTIILNNCLDYIRKRSKEIAHIKEEYNGDVYLEPDVLEKLKLDDILKLVQALPPATGAVFNLFAIEGYSHKEISTMLNISEGTSKWHLNAARKLLQQQLKNIQPVHE